MYDVNNYLKTRLQTKIAIMKHLIKYVFVLSLVFVGCSDSDDQSTETTDDGVVFNSLQANPAPLPRDCEATNPFVGVTRPLRVSTLYGISGLVTIVSDCEIEISNFFYNGAGPNISVYAGIDNDFEGGVNMSEPINGQVFEGETLRLFLPEGASFNEFNSISIWCYEFDVDFSSVLFQE